MSQILWIEDEADRLPDVPAALKSKGQSLSVFSNPKELQEFLAPLKQLPGPIVLDLSLPAIFDGNHQSEIVEGLQVGIELLGWLNDRFSEGLKVFVVSGNIDLDVRDQLTGDLRVPEERIFEKPLNEDFDRLIKDLVASAKSFPDPE